MKMTDHAVLLSLPKEDFTLSLVLRTFCFPIPLPLFPRFFWGGPAYLYAPYGPA